MVFLRKTICSFALLGLVLSGTPLQAKPSTRTSGNVARFVFSGLVVFAESTFAGLAATRPFTKEGFDEKSALFAVLMTVGKRTFTEISSFTEKQREKSKNLLQEKNNKMTQESRRRTAIIETTQEQYEAIALGLTQSEFDGACRILTLLTTDINSVVAEYIQDNTQLLNQIRVATAMRPIHMIPLIHVQAITLLESDNPLQELKAYVELAQEKAHEQIDSKTAVIYFDNVIDSIKSSDREIEKLRAYLVSLLKGYQTKGVKLVCIFNTAQAHSIDPALKGLMRHVEKTNGENNEKTIVVDEQSTV